MTATRRRYHHGDLRAALIDTAVELIAERGVRGFSLAEAAIDNVASIRAIEKAGFHREGILREHCRTHGRSHDCVMFSLVPQDLSGELAGREGGGSRSAPS